MLPGCSQEAPRRLPGGSLEAPAARRRPGGSQEAPRRPWEAPGGPGDPQMGPRRSREAPGSPRPPKNGAKMGSPTPHNEALQSSIFWGFQELTRATKDPLELPRRALKTGVKT